MLKKLRRKFIAIVMTLVGLVLVLALGLSLYSAWSAQDGLIQHSLEHSLEGELDSVPMIGSGRGQDDGKGGYGMLALSLEISPEGYVLQTSNAPVTINGGVLDDVIARIVDGTAQGKDRNAHVAWKSRTLDSDTIRIAIVDTSASDASFESLAAKYVLISLATLGVLFAIAWRLSSWSLKPVEEAFRQQQRFVADASHELKTPLSVIIANTEILQKDAALGEQSRRWVDSTAEEASHMKGLVEDLLQLARADETASGDAVGALRPEDLDFSEIVEDAALEFDAVAFERGLSIDADVEEGIRVRGDRAWLERVVRVLIDNACKYGAKGTAVTVSLHRGAPQGAGPAGRGPAKADRLTLSVNDRGDVIPAEDLPHLFERFWRSDKARTRTDGAGGFGLGLAIAKSTVEAHGGTISATSAEDAGTTFTVVLPTI